MLPSSELKEVNIKDYLVILKRRIWVILACFIVIASWSTLSTFKKIPLYQATAQILIESGEQTVVPIMPVTGLNQDVQTEIGVLSSRNLAKAVVEALENEGDKTFNGNEYAFLGGAKIEGQRNTRLINISYISSDPIKAAKYANILVDTYIKQDEEKRTGTTKGAQKWLEQQVSEALKKVEDSQTAVTEYLKKNEIVSTPDWDKKTTGPLEVLKADKVTAEKEIAELSKRYKAKHPKMIAATTRLETLNKKIVDETKRYQDVLDKLQQYNILMRELEQNRALYDSLVKREKETGVTTELKTTSIRVIDYANVPGNPFTPDRKKDITTGMMLGLFLGLGLALFLEYLDSTVKSADDVEVYVKLPFLGYVPSGKEEVKVKSDIDLVVHKMPQSRVAEAYRSIRTSIMFSAPEDRPLKSILITSASPQEGKTSVALNLGIVFARANEKVLLIDADMRRSRMYQILGLDRRVGLSSFLTGTATADTIIKQTFIPNLYFISSGPIPPNPAELLHSAKIRAFLEDMKGKFDRIILDSPPVTTVADTSLLANVADGVIDVVRAGFLNIDVILRGKQRLVEAKSRIIGVILNNVDVKREDSYYYYHYYYAEDKQKS